MNTVIILKLGVIKIAEENRDYVAGFICRQKLSGEQNFVHATPGIILLRIDTLGHIL